MKKVLLLLLLSAAMNSATNAQVEKGNVLVGGDLANLQLGLNGGSNFSMLVTPKVAWFVQDKVAFGGYGLLGLETAKGAGVSFNYGVGALGRYYTGTRALDNVPRTRFFVESSVGIEGYNPSVGDNTNGLALGVGPGLAYFITPNIGIEGLLKYTGLIGFGSAATSSILNLNVGFQVYLPKRTAINAVKDVTQ